MRDKLFYFTDKEEIAIRNAIILAEKFMRNYGKANTPRPQLVRGIVKIHRTIIWRSFQKIHKEFPMLTRSMLETWDVRRDKIDDAYDYREVKRRYEDMEVRMKSDCKGWVTQGDLLDFGIPLATIRYASQIGLVQTRRTSKGVEYLYADVKQVMQNYTQKLIYDTYLKTKNVRPDK